MADIVCLTGMHRSGTSLTASWLQRCGLVIDIGGLVGAAIGNPRGHFEDLEIMRLQQQELLAQRPRSSGWRVTRPEHLSFTGDRIEQVRALIEDRSARFPVWGWKDPRSVLFARDWKRLAPGLVTVILWRPAGEVVDSLARRTRQRGSRGMRVSRRTAWQTWAAYNAVARDLKQEHPESVLLIPLRRVLSADGEVLDLLTSRFGLPLRRVPVAEKFEPALLSGHDAPLAESTVAPWNRAPARAALQLEGDLAALSDV